MAKKRGRPAGSQNRSTKPTKKERNLAWSIVLTGLGVFILALTYVPGTNLWSLLRLNFLFGMFGLCAYLLGPITLYTAYMTANGKPVSAKMVQGALLIMLLCACLHVFFAGEIKGDTFQAQITYLYDLGVNMYGGGAAAFLAIPLTATLGAVGAKIVLVILLVMMAMLLSSTSPVDIMNFVNKILGKTKQALTPAPRTYSEAKQQKVRVSSGDNFEQTGMFSKSDFKRAKAERTAQHMSEIDIPIVPKSNIDIDLGPLEHKNKQEDSVAVDRGRQNANTNDSALGKKPQSVFDQAAATKTDTKQPHSTYKYPSIELFERSKVQPNQTSDAELKRNAELLVKTLASFGVQTTIDQISRGPSVTRYELKPLPGVKISKITNLADDIAMNLAASGVRIEAPIPNKAAVGIEVPNKTASTVDMRGVLESKQFTNASSPLAIALGKDIAGNVLVADLTRMPHLLIAGSTGSGKSVFINSIITSILYRCSPDDVKLILIDPKVVELREYNGIPHLFIPVVTEPREAAKALAAAVTLMEQRYRLFAEKGVRDIKTYNALDKHDGQFEKMPYLAIIIDELADLMMTAGKDVEDYICRLAQKARAAGIHLIVATQRPSVDVITGLIKANIPSRISFAVSSQVDSRTILDQSGAEKLLGNGDMLFLPIGETKPIRVQGVYVKDSEIENIVTAVKKEVTAEYNEQLLEDMKKVTLSGEKNAEELGDDESDPMLKKAIEVAVETGQISTSLLQRKLGIGYGRAARIIDRMEAMNVIGPYAGSKPREVRLSRQQWIEMTLNDQL